MKGKYRKKKNKTVRWLLIIIALLLTAIAAMWITVLSRQQEEMPVPGTTQAQEDRTEAEPVTETGGETLVPETTAVETEGLFQPVDLGDGVYIQEVGNYTGIYMEDGSDELVSDVMMILLTNTSSSDIQLMDIELEFREGTYQFRATNLRSGGSAVLLEQNRAAKPAGNPISAAAVNTALFHEPMKADFSVYEISGADGALNVKNISGEDISGSIFVYYKYKSQDLYYGGITFRVEIKDGLKAGEVRQIMTSHYNPDSCEIVLIENRQNNGN